MRAEVDRLRVLSPKLHRLLDFVLVAAEAVFFVALPYLAGFGPGSPAKRFCVTMAALIFPVWLLTDYRGTESSPI